MSKFTDVKSGLIFLKGILLFLMPYLFAYIFEHGVTHFMGTKWVAESVFSVSALYQNVITFGPRELRQNYTVLVDINPKKDKEYKAAVPDTLSACTENGERYGLARMLKKIDEQSPAIIVFDGHFPDACRDEDIGTSALLDTLQEISHRTPIVLGRLALTSKQIKDTGSGYKGKNPVLEASEPCLTFEQTSEQKIVEGILNIHKDYRKAPFHWQARPEEISEIKEIPTLSFAAVKVYLESFSKQSVMNDKFPRVKKLLEQKMYAPYISFIELDKFDIIKAGKLLTGDPSENFSRIRGKIVVIGKSGNLDDMHDSVFGTQLPGFIIQANNIEAMLDQRYYDSSLWLDYGLGFLVFVAVQYCGQKNKKMRPFLVYLGLIIVVALLLLYLSVALFGFYINPITITILGLLIIVAHHFFPEQETHLLIKELFNRGKNYVRFPR